MLPIHSLHKVLLIKTDVLCNLINESEPVVLCNFVHVQMNATCKINYTQLPLIVGVSGNYRLIRYYFDANFRFCYSLFHHDCENYINQNMLRLLFYIAVWVPLVLTAVVLTAVSTRGLCTRITPTNMTVGPVHSVFFTQHRSPMLPPTRSAFLAMLYFRKTQILVSKGRCLSKQDVDSIGESDNVCYHNSSLSTFAV